MNFNPFKKQELPKQESYDHIPRKYPEQPLYSDDNAIGLQERFGTIDVTKIDAMIKEKIKSGEWSEVSQKEEPAGSPATASPGGISIDPPKPGETGSKPLGKAA